MSYINLSFTQCKQLVNRGYYLRDFVQTIEDQPEFIKHMQPIDSISEIAAIQEGGCSSGAYMPAVTYNTARETMAEYGDDVLDFIELHSDGLPVIPKGTSWSEISVLYLSYAVELWVQQFDIDGINWD